MTEWGQAVREYKRHRNDRVTPPVGYMGGVPDDRVLSLADAAIAELEDRAAYLHGHNVSLMAEVERLRAERGCEDGECHLALLSEVERLRLQYRPDAVDKCIDELKTEIERLTEEVEIWKDGWRRREEECEDLSDRLDERDAEVERSDEAWRTEGQYRIEAEAEVERLTWMLHEAAELVVGVRYQFHGTLADVEDIKADLARRWEERNV